MKLQHTLGGLEGLDPVQPELRVFVEPWEERIFGIPHRHDGAQPAAQPAADIEHFRTVWTWADLRKGAEAMNPFDYFKYRYYEKWLGGISGYFVANGYITQAELDARTDEYLADPAKPLPSGGTPEVDDRIHKYLMDGDSPWHQWADKPRFAVGDEVLVADPPTVEHTRLPGYLRNKVGVVETVYDDAFSYLCSTGPDGIGPAMPVYCVKFDPQHLWPATPSRASSSTPICSTPTYARSRTGPPREEQPI